MKLLFNSLNFFIFLFVVACASPVSAANQTPDFSPIFPVEGVPFRVRLEVLKDQEGNDFLLPNGLHSYNIGVYDGKWLLINGRTNGLHGFHHDPTNFPPQKQNTVLYVIDPVKRRGFSRAITSAHSGLNPDQIESLSVTAAQSYQEGDYLYLSGGYGFKRSRNSGATFDILTSIYLPGLIRWVTHCEKELATCHIRQISHPIFELTGGDMRKLSKKSPTLLIFGHDFQGDYFFGPFTQIYSEQIRRFHIRDDGQHLSVDIKTSQPLLPDPSFRRRDLNVVPVVARVSNRKLKYGLVALSGVFTPSFGMWTVPVTITSQGIPSMADPANPLTFKQGMNNYTSPTLGLFSSRTGDMYTTIFGGISGGFFENGVFQTDPELPFINQITTIKIDQNGNFSQYLMDEQFPTILSTGSNPGNPLLFGASAQFIPANDLESVLYENGVFKLDKIKKPLLIGYIVGGIQSTVPNTVLDSDSAASPYIFTVVLEPVLESDY